MDDGPMCIDCGEYPQGEGGRCHQCGWAHRGYGGSRRPRYPRDGDDSLLERAIERHRLGKERHSKWKSPLKRDHVEAPTPVAGAPYGHDAIDGVVYYTKRHQDCAYEAYPFGRASDDAEKLHP